MQSQALHYSVASPSGISPQNALEDVIVGAGLRMDDPSSRGAVPELPEL
jgi:hypothetical protein